MKTKIFSLLAFIMLVVTVPIMAQTPFQWGEIPYEITGDTTATTTTTTTDTTIVVTTPIETTVVIPIYQRTWKKLEKQLKDEFKKDFNGVEQIGKDEVQFAYEVEAVPTKNGRKTLYLCYLKSGMYFASSENPNQHQILNVGPGYWQGDGKLPEKQTDTIQTPERIRLGWDDL